MNLKDFPRTDTAWHIVDTQGNIVATEPTRARARAVRNSMSTPTTIYRATVTYGTPERAMRA